MEKASRPAFIIAHKYFRGQISYLKYYINNIQEFYPESLTIVVDNNSAYGDDIFDDLQEYDKVIILENNSESKFEIGAYCEGIRYILKEGIDQDYEYFVFTQDNYIIKKRYEFEKHTHKACPIHSAHHIGYQAQWMGGEIAQHLLEKLDIGDPRFLKQCWCSSFVLHKSKVEPFLDLLGFAKLTTRRDSEAGERYLSPVLYYLNDNTRPPGHPSGVNDIDHSPVFTQYDAFNVDLKGPPAPDHYFMKSLQRKTEHTEDE